MDIKTGQLLELRDVLITEDTRVTGEDAWVMMDNATIQLGESNISIGELSILPSGELVNISDFGKRFTSISEETQAYTIYSSALDSVTVTGSSLTLDLSGIAITYAEAWKEHEYIALSFFLPGGRGLIERPWGLPTQGVPAR